MMYRINLYPEYQQARQAQRRRARITAVATGLLGLELLLVGALLVGDVLLREQIATRRAELPALRTSLGRRNDPCPHFALAQEMTELLAGRVVWAPKLAALAEQQGGRLGLTSVAGRLEERGGKAWLTVTGTCADDAGLPEVNRYVTALRSDPRVKDDLPTVALGTLHGDRGAEFEVQCRNGEVQP